MRPKLPKIGTEGDWLPAAPGDNFCIGLSFGGRKTIAIGLSTGHTFLLSLIAIFIKIRYLWMRSRNAAQTHKHVAILELTLRDALLQSRKRPGRMIHERRNNP